MAKRNYIISKDFKGGSFSTKKFKKLNSFELQNHSKSNAFNTSKINIMSNMLIHNLLSNKYYTKLKKINIVIDDEDSSSSDLKIVLDEASKLRSILLNTYIKFYEEEEIKEFLSKLNISIKKIGIKIIMKEEKFINNMVLNQEEKIGKSR